MHRVTDWDVRYIIGTFLCSKALGSVTEDVKTIKVVSSNLRTALEQVP